MVDNLAPGEKSIIASEVFTVIESSSTMNVEVLRSYTDFCVKAGIIEEALNKLMEQPASKYTVAAYGQLSSFISKLSEDEAKRFTDYLSTNNDLKNTIIRGEQLKSITKRK
jgi:hypothetical protein